MLGTGSQTGTYWLHSHHSVMKNELAITMAIQIAGSTLDYRKNYFIVKSICITEILSCNAFCQLYGFNLANGQLGGRWSTPQKRSTLRKMLYA